jgi:hypothetical protein
MNKKLLNKDDDGFPNQLKGIRKSLRLDCFQFSMRCHISKTTLRRIENVLLKDHQMPGQITWDKINNFLTEIKYFESDLEDKSRLIPNFRDPLIAYNGPYRSFWQPVTPYQ